MKRLFTSPLINHTLIGENHKSVQVISVEMESLFGYWVLGCGVFLQFLDQILKEGRKEMFYLTMHSKHFIYGYIESDIW